MTLLLHSTSPPAHLRRVGSPRLLDPQDGPMLSSLFVRKARSAHDLTLDLTAHAQRKLRTVVSELFSDVLSSEKPPPRPPHAVDLFPRLPEELLIAILLYLDGSSIAACNQTCRGLRQAISHSMQLQYEIALFSCGMRDGPRTDANHEVQLNRLLAYDAAWRQLAWTDARSMDHLAGAFHPTAISGSTIAFIPFGPGPVSGVRMLIQQFPSALRGTEVRQWELQFQLMSVHDTFMDVSQDLLILLESDSLADYTMIYHVYSLSTGRPHPLAANDGIIEVPEGRTISLGASGLCGDFIGATAYSPSDKSTRLVLWNWKTGERKVDAPLPTPELGLRPMFSFLDRHHILVGFLWWSESQPRDLLVCALDGQRLHDDDDDDDGPIDAVSTYQFRIPKMFKRRDFWEIHMHRNSVPLRSGCPSAFTSADHHYFDNDPADQLIVIEMASRRYRPSPEKLDPAMSLCIPTRTILRRIARARPSLPPPSPRLPPPPPAAIPRTARPPLIFSWEQWGERGALLTKRFDIDRRLPNLSRVCGLRHVARKPVVRPDGKPAIFRVTDFHPGRATRIAQSRATGNGGCSGGGSVSSSSSSLAHAITEVPLPVELQSVDPALISTSICQDALIAFERVDPNLSGLRRVFVCSF
ncbi:hypothetical protein BJY52DRAFT_101187 [Lactarius psammicola]|nr:hypothetical protein BJY52DRAFT_101187 [Lactarius psammicola]